jgi:hypothetical protein
MSAPPFTVRLSPALRQLLAQVAHTEDRADALRALLILGAAQAGLDTAALQRDTAALLALDLAPDVQAALQAMYSPENTTRIQREYNHREPTVTSTGNEQNGRLELDDDPLLGIGIEV